MESCDLPMVYRNIVSRRAVCTGTDIQKQSLRSYFTSRSVSESAQLRNRWSIVGQEICKIIAGIPWMLEVFLDCGFGGPYLATMLIQVLKHDNPAAFHDIIQYGSLPERFAARRVDETHYKYVWTHYVPVMREAILDTYLRLDGLVIDTDAFLSIIPSLSPSKLEFILNHPNHKYLVYKLTSPYAFVEKQVRQQYTYETCMSEPTIILNYGVHQYVNAECLLKQIKQTRRVHNWRFMFWCGVLHSRMMEFRERYWALSGKHVIAAAAEFYELSGLTDKAVKSDNHTVTI
jgi:hypothetical protein